MAGSISGYSGRNSLGLQAEFLSRYLERGFDLVADCLLNATFSDEELDKERRIIIDDIARRRTTWSGGVPAVPIRACGRSTPIASILSARWNLWRGSPGASYCNTFVATTAIKNLTLAVVGDVEPNRVDRQGRDTLLRRLRSKRATVRGRR